MLGELHKLLIIFQVLSFCFLPMPFFLHRKDMTLGLNCKWCSLLVQIVRFIKSLFLRLSWTKVWNSTLDQCERIACWAAWYLLLVLVVQGIVLLWSRWILLFSFLLVWNWSNYWRHIKLLDFLDYQLCILFHQESSFYCSQKYCSEL